MPSIEAIDWYDLPRYYDLVFDEGTELEATFLEWVAGTYGRGLAQSKRRVLEPACGSGRLVVAMAERGWKVTGTDLSQPMLEHATERLKECGQKARLVHADMASAQPKGKYDLAHCLVSTFKYLSSEKAAAAHLNHVADSLAPGGVYVLGLHLSDYKSTKMERERWIVESQGTHVVCNIQTWPPDRAKRTERVRSRLTVTEGSSIRRTETNWHFRTYDAAQLRRLLAKAPAFEHSATFDFHYDTKAPAELDDDCYDTVLILTKRRL